jgi:hypothetical protein
VNIEAVMGFKIGRYLQTYISKLRPCVLGEWLSSEIEVPDFISQFFIFGCILFDLETTGHRHPKLFVQSLVPRRVFNDVWKET